MYDHGWFAIALLCFKVFHLMYHFLLIWIFRYFLSNYNLSIFIFAGNGYAQRIMLPTLPSTFLKVFTHNMRHFAAVSCFVIRANVMTNKTAKL